MNDAVTQPDRKRRPLWPWVTGAVVLCLLAVGGSFWWPVHKANELVTFARAHRGAVTFIPQHPPWMKRFISDETFVPGYDHFENYYVTNVPISDDRFRTLCQNADLYYLELDISNCSPESLSELKHQTNLSAVHFYNCWQEEFPLEWLQSVRIGCKVSLDGLTVTPEQWPELLTARVHYLRTSEKNCGFTISSEVPELDRSLAISRKNLTQTEADAIVQIPDLKRLTLSYATATPEFWQTLSRHPQLESLRIRSGSKTEPRMITETELDYIAKLPSLSELTIFDDLNQLELETATCERFAELRPDVSFIFYTAGTPPSLIPHVFGRAQETTTDDE